MKRTQIKAAQHGRGGQSAGGRPAQRVPERAILLQVPLEVLPEALDLLDLLHAGCGRRLVRGSVGVHKDQALVLVNYNDIEGSDSASEILQLAQEIQRTVKTEFGIDLEVEPRIYGSL